jgi:hypothetical protein
MKGLEFWDYLVPMVLSGEKDSTWRLFDDKNLSVDDSEMYAEHTKYYKVPIEPGTSVKILWFELERSSIPDSNE